MKKVHTIYGLLIALLLVAPVSYIGLDTVRAADEDETELHKQMEVMDEALKKLRRLVRKDDDESKKEALNQLDILASSSIESKKLIPLLAQKIPAEQRDEFIMDYRRDMAHFLSEVYRMEVLVIDGKLDEAQELYKQMKVLEEEGHEKFMEKEE